MARMGFLCRRWMRLFPIRYICTGELPGLQKEVRQEPRLALDGGPDGLSFYRAITNNWLGLLKPGGVAAVEIGNGQENAVRIC